MSEKDKLFKILRYAVYIVVGIIVLKLLIVLFALIISFLIPFFLVH